MGRPAQYPALPQRYRDARRDPGLAVLEGFHALKHAIRFHADILDVRAADPDSLGNLARRMAPDVADRIIDQAHAVDHATFQQLSPTPHPNGVIALARRPVTDAAALLHAPGRAHIILLDRPTHHGNMGAVIRVAAAAGAGAVLTTGPHDPWHPAAIRGGAGLHFALPVARMDTLPQTERTIIALDPEGEPLERGLPPGAVLVFGSERGGVSSELLKRAGRRVALPMRPGVSSLNLATAVAITLYCNAGPDSPGG